MGVCLIAYHACYRGLRVNVPKDCQILIFTFQRANKRTKGVSIFQLRLPKGVPIFQLFFRGIFQLWSVFAHFENISAILENLSRETSNLNFDICKISSRKNFVNLKPLMSFSMEHVGLTVQLFGYGKIERNIYFLST